MDYHFKSENTVPSSPPAAVFSDEAQLQSSPPSSPPGFPWEQPKPATNATKPVQNVTKNAFSVLGKRKALDSIGENARPAKKATAISSTTSRAPLTQMQISLGQEVQKKCKKCGMEYIASSAEDRNLHNKYHRQSTEGYDVGKDFIRTARPHTTFQGAAAGDTICVLDHSDSVARRKRGDAVLEIVQRDLGAVEIPQAAIWSSDAIYKMYLYIRGRRCIGCLLSQRITGARPTVEAAQGSSGLQLSEKTAPATLGISRIWTLPSHRHSGIATRLLDTATEELPKEAVAFSQPTDAGQGLARRWFGTAFGWRVYVD